MIKKVKKTVFLTLGHLFFAIGTIGIFLPILPTVPFYLLALGCYFRSSERFHAAMLNNKYYGQSLQDWQREKAISRRSKFMAVGMIWFSIPVAAYFAPIFAVKVLLIVIGVVVSAYIITRAEPSSVAELADESI
ncbi:MAG TPA: YbaN family protein [Candidatus Doudnabacteria bacterium]|nr:YbaN family protein [Candidatus Doudnabacteria bacterium]